MGLGKPSPKSAADRPVQTGAPARADKDRWQLDHHSSQAPRAKQTNPSLPASTGARIAYVRPWPNRSSMPPKAGPSLILPC